MEKDHWLRAEFLRKLGLCAKTTDDKAYCDELALKHTRLSIIRN